MDFWIYYGGGKDVLDVGGKAVSRKQKGEKLKEVENRSQACKKLSHGSGRAVFFVKVEKLSYESGKAVSC
jgi:hypothetical protein